VHDVLAQLPSKYNKEIFSDSQNSDLKEKLRMFCIAAKPKNSTSQLLKHLGFKYDPKTGDIVTLSREEIEQVAKETDENADTEAV